MKVLTFASPATSVVRDMLTLGLATTLYLVLFLCWNLVSFIFFPMNSPLQSLTLNLLLLTVIAAPSRSCPAANRAIRPSAATAILLQIKKAIVLSGNHLTIHIWFEDFFFFFLVCEEVWNNTLLTWTAGYWRTKPRYPYSIASTNFFLSHLTDFFCEKNQ